MVRSMPNRGERRKSSDNLMLQTRPKLNQTNSQFACTHTDNFGDKKKNPETEKKTDGQAEDVATVRTPCVKKIGEPCRFGKTIDNNELNTARDKQNTIGDCTKTRTRPSTKLTKPSQVTKAPRKEVT